MKGMKKRMTKKTLSAVLMSVMLAGSVLIMSGCESSSSSDSSSDLPTNPQLADSAAEKWTFVYKEWDHTFRIRWPTHFYREYGIGPGSYNIIRSDALAEDQRAEFRSYDIDSGRRTSYTAPGPSSRLGPAGTPITVILYLSDGTAVGWFSTTIEGVRGGSLPQ